MCLKQCLGGSAAFPSRCRASDFSGSARPTDRGCTVARAPYALLRLPRCNYPLPSNPRSPFPQELSARAWADGWLVGYMAVEGRGGDGEPGGTHVGAAAEKCWWVGWWVLHYHDLWLPCPQWAVAKALRTRPPVSAHPVECVADTVQIGHFVK